jgi:phosphoribosylformylglycinamidine synthase PurS subunit
MWEATIHVTLREGVLDPQGQAVLKCLHQLGFDTLRDVQVGKFMVVRLEADSNVQAGQLVDAMCQQLLANPVIEDYYWELAEVSK